MPSGVKLVEAQKVLDFVQFMNPGPYQSVPADHYEPGGPPTATEFGAQLSRSLERAAQLKLKFEAPAAPGDVVWLRELLLPAQNTGRFGRDQIAELAAARLIKVAAPATLAELYLQTKERFTARILADGLNTAPGRALLMKRIGDAGEPRANRLRYAGAVGNFNLLLVPDTAVLRDLATLALQVRADEKLAEIILDSLGASSQISYGSPQSAREAAQKWRPALAQLRQLHGQTSSPKLRFLIETLTFNADPQALPRFYPSLGPVLSLLNLPDDPSRYGKPAGRALVVEYEIRVVRANAKGWTPQIELRNLATKRSTFLPAPFADKLSFAQLSNASGIEPLTIPANVPPGQYLVRCRFLKAGQIMSVGHGFETQL